MTKRIFDTRVMGETELDDVLTGGWTEDLDGVHWKQSRFSGVLL